MSAAKFATRGLQACRNTAMTCPCHDTRQYRLANFERIATEVVTIQLDQIEGIKERATVMSPVADVIEGHHAIAVTDHRLPIDDAGPRAQPSDSFGNQGEAVRQVIAGTAVEPHLGAVLAGDDPEAITTVKTDKAPNWLSNHDQFAEVVDTATQNLKRPFP